MKKLSTGLLALGLVMAVSVGSASAEAGQIMIQNNFSLSQTVEDPPLKLYFRQPDGTPDNNYTVGFELRSSSLECLGPSNGAPSGVIGTDAEPIFVSVPQSVENWSLAVRTSDKAWVGLNPNHTISIDDKTDGGCSRNPANNPSDTRPGGLLSVVPGNIKLKSTCAYDCSDNPIITANESNFAISDGDTIPVTYSVTPNAGWQGTISGIRLIQTMPANLSPDSYTLPMLICLLAL